MRIAIIGATGSIGKGFAKQFSADKKHIIYFCSRNERRAITMSNECSDNVVPCTNEYGINIADIVIFAIPYEGLENIYKFDFKDNQIIISPIVNFNHQGDMSVAEEIQEKLPFTHVVGAFHNIPAHIMETSEKRPTILVCANHEESKKTIIELINKSTMFYALNTGDLKSARTVERITPLLIKIAKINGLKDLSIKIE